LVDDYLTMLELILERVDEPQHELHHQDGRNYEDYDQGDDHPRLELVLNTYESARKDRVPKQVFEDMHKFQPSPFLFDLR
jgi:hypothetical protein